MSCGSNTRIIQVTGDTIDFTTLDAAQTAALCAAVEANCNVATSLNVNGANLELIDGQGDVLSTVPFAAADTIGDADGDSGVNVVEGGAADGGDQIDFTVDGTVVMSINNDKLTLNGLFIDPPTGLELVPQATNPAPVGSDADATVWVDSANKKLWHGDRNLEDNVSGVAGNIITADAEGQAFLDGPSASAAVISTDANNALVQGGDNNLFVPQAAAAPVDDVTVGSGAAQTGNVSVPVSASGTEGVIDLDNVSAAPIADAGGLITAPDIEGALQELAATAHADDDVETVTGTAVDVTDPRNPVIDLQLIVSADANNAVVAGTDLGAFVDSQGLAADIDMAANMLQLRDGAGNALGTPVDLTPYLDDSNLAFITMGSVDGAGIATFTRDDASTFTVDFSSFLTDLAFTGADGTNPGTQGDVPAPTATDNTRFLRGDGTWADVPAPHADDDVETVTGNLVDVTDPRNPVIDAPAIDALTDVDTTTTPPTDGQALIWNNAASVWEPTSLAAGHPDDDVETVTGTAVDVTDARNVVIDHTTSAEASYDNTASGLTATDAQAAIDELAGNAHADDDVETVTGTAVDVTDPRNPVIDLQVIVSGDANNAVSAGTDLGAFLDAQGLAASIDLAANMLQLRDGAGNALGAAVDLSLYIDDTNLAYIQSGSLDGGTGIATFTRDDASTFTIDFSAFLSDLAFTGADGTNPGTQGDVPAPTATDNNKALFGDATYKDVVQTVTGSNVDVTDPANPVVNSEIDQIEQFNGTFDFASYTGGKERVRIVNSSNIGIPVVTGLVDADVTVEHNSYADFELYDGAWYPESVAASIASTNTIVQTGPLTVTDADAGTLFVKTDDGTANALVFSGGLTQGEYFVKTGVGLTDTRLTVGTAFNKIIYDTDGAVVTNLSAGTQHSVALPLADQLYRISVNGADLSAFPMRGGAATAHYAEDTEALLLAITPENGSSGFVKTTGQFFEYQGGAWAATSPRNGNLASATNLAQDETYIQLDPTAGTYFGISVTAENYVEIDTPSPVIGAGDTVRIRLRNNSATQACDFEFLSPYWRNTEGGDLGTIGVPPATTRWLEFQSDGTRAYEVGSQKDPSAWTMANFTALNPLTIAVNDGVSEKTWIGGTPTAGDQTFNVTSTNYILGSILAFSNQRDTDNVVVNFDIDLISPFNTSATSATLKPGQSMIVVRTTGTSERWLAVGSVSEPLEINFNRSEAGLGLGATDDLRYEFTPQITGNYTYDFGAAAPGGTIDVTMGTTLDGNETHQVTLGAGTAAFVNDTGSFTLQAGQTYYIRFDPSAGVVFDDASVDIEYAPASDVTPTLINSSAGVVTETLPASTGAGAVRFYTNIDVTNTATLAVQPGETLNGVTDGTFLFSNYVAGTQFRADEVTGGWVVSVVGASAQTGLYRGYFANSAYASAVSSVIGSYAVLDLSDMNDAYGRSVGLEGFDQTENTWVAPKDGTYRVHYAAGLPQSSPNSGQISLAVEGSTVAISGDAFTGAIGGATHTSVEAILTLTAGERLEFVFGDGVVTSGGGRPYRPHLVIEQLPTTEAVLAGMVTPQALAYGRMVLDGSTGAANDLGTSASPTKAVYETVNGLVGASANATTGEFTITQNGNYEFSMYHSAENRGADMAASLYVDGTEVERINGQVAGGGADAGAFLFIFSRVSLTIGQVVDVRLSGSVADDVGDQNRVGVVEYFELNQVPSSTVVMPDALEVEDNEVLLGSFTGLAANAVSSLNESWASIVANYDEVRFQLTSPVSGTNYTHTLDVKTNALDGVGIKRLAMYGDGTNGLIIDITAANFATDEFTYVPSGLFGLGAVDVYGVKAQKTVINTTDIPVVNQSSQVDGGLLKWNATLEAYEPFSGAVGGIIESGQGSTGNGPGSVTFAAAEADTNYRVFVTPTSGGNGQTVCVTGKTTTGFTVYAVDVNGAPRTLNFDWMIIR